MAGVGRPSKINANPGLVLLDAAAVILLFFLGLSEMRAAGDDIFFRSVDLLGVMLLVGVTAPAAIRRFAPVPVVLACCLAQTMLMLSGYAPTNALLAIPFGLYTVACATPRRTTVITTLLALLVFAVPALDDDTGSIQLFIVTLVIFAATALAGDGAKARRLYAETVEYRAAQAEERRELSMREAVVAERARLARELHDAVGHTVNVLVMHAGAGRVASANDPARATGVLSEIEGIGRAALSDIDRLLGLLRDDEDHGASRQPAPGIAEIPALVERLRTTGLHIGLDTPASPPAVPMTVSAAAYRITQEALTNAVKLAGPAAVSIRLTIDDEAVILTVEDDGRGASAIPDQDRVGRGLIGMRERVSLLGGTIDTGPRVGGGYRVHAVLPLSPAPGRSDASTPSRERSSR